ncbi:hypothetical protein [Phytohabitans kaempferiae]|uniref:Uncharacterized protein n=1 Tax=Phytohabitans kaempferiae TaxID=1620943 RepID=A0ABV6M0L1_9ACTN
MTTTTTTRRLHVRPIDTDRLRDFATHLRTVLSTYNRNTGRVLAVHCPTCRHWVKPRHYLVTAGTCRRCARNRDTAAYQTARDRIRHRH